ncbi:hypothetical protein K8T06_05535, partial [bacterium]|nr:hypothetical protein [bacterium]
VMVTHDRYLLDRIADRIWTLEDKTFIEYPGNYSDYKHLKALAEQHKSIEKTDQDQKEQDRSPKSRREQRKARAEIRKITGKSAAYYEKEIERLELERDAVQEEMKNPEIAYDWNTLDELENKCRNLQEELNRILELWERAAEAEAELDANLSN